MKRIAVRVLMAALGVVVAGLAFIFVSPDYDMYFVRSGSMVPTINIGDMVITGPVGGPLTEELKPGTVITFQQGKNVFTHRVVSIKGTEITTKGDANEDPDQAPVPVSKVMGVYIFKVPYIGYIVSFARSKMGWFLVILVPTALLLGLLVKDILKEAFRTEPAAPRKRQDKAAVGEPTTQTFEAVRTSEPAAPRKTPDKTASNKPATQPLPKTETSPRKSQSDARLREIIVKTLGDIEHRDTHLRSVLMEALINVERSDARLRAVLIETLGY